MTYDEFKAEVLDHYNVNRSLYFPLEMAIDDVYCGYPESFCLEGHVRRMKKEYSNYLSYCGELN